MIQQESWYSIDFIFCRFLLICQLEGLDHTFTLKWFFSLEILQNSLRIQSGNRCSRCFLRTDLQTCFHGFSDLWAADFSENIWDIFSSSCAVQKEVHFEHSVGKIFPSLFRRKILFLFNFGERFYLGRECFSQSCYS